MGVYLRVFDKEIKIGESAVIIVLLRKNEVILCGHGRDECQWERKLIVAQMDIPSEGMKDSRGWSNRVMKKSMSPKNNQSACEYLTARWAWTSLAQ
jgi:transposase